MTTTTTTIELEGIHPIARDVDGVACRGVLFRLANASALAHFGALPAGVVRDAVEFAHEASEEISRNGRDGSLSPRLLALGASLVVAIDRAVATSDDEPTPVLVVARDEFDFAAARARLARDL